MNHTFATSACVSRTAYGGGRSRSRSRSRVRVAVIPVLVHLSPEICLQVSQQPACVPVSQQRSSLPFRLQQLLTAVHGGQQITATPMYRCKTLGRADIRKLAPVGHELAFTGAHWCTLLHTWSQLGARLLSTGVWKVIYRRWH